MSRFIATILLLCALCPPALLGQSIPNRGIAVAKVARPSAPRSTPDLLDLVRHAHWLCRQGLDYQFGADQPEAGGLDCSGTIQFLLKSIGISGVPRTAYDQYCWTKSHRLLRRPAPWKGADAVLNDLRPGDLLFWSGTYSTARPVSHVMIYAGRHPKTQKPMVFGAKGTTKRGTHDSGIDFFPLSLNLGKGTRFVGASRIPGLQY